MALTRRGLRGRLGQGCMQRAEAALHQAQALGEARLLALQQLLHLPHSCQELLPAWAALRAPQAFSTHSPSTHQASLGPVICPRWPNAGVLNPNAVWEIPSCGVACYILTWQRIALIALLFLGEMPQLVLLDLEPCPTSMLENNRKTDVL